MKHLYLATLEDPFCLGIQNYLVDLQSEYIINEEQSVKWTINWYYLGNLC